MANLYLPSPISLQVETSSELKKEERLDCMLSLEVSLESSLTLLLEMESRLEN